MQRLIAAALLLAAAKLSGEPCAPSQTKLCLNAGRFAAEVSWKDFQGNTGEGKAVALTSDTGYFWFFNDSNIELVAKVLDARALNGHFWVFYGALSNVEYTLTVSDTATGQTRTYTNPSGTFGSVGDTEAFSAAATTVAAAAGAVQLERGASPAISPCLEEATSLSLSNCRFRVSVVWKDFQGNTGEGQAVALTSDTGYFWFFNDANVELVVKVLDARAINGRFWVFYGALSNVEYEITVTDTLTGNLNTYSNPSSRFASAGDTDGFRSGYSVLASLDESRAVSKEISPSGGEISATGADGAVYTLQIPQDALLSAETITLTPVTRIEGLPLSGGLAAAVQLAPEGLRLLELATLTISPANAVPLPEEITFAWRGSGEEFSLYPPGLGTHGVSMSLIYFHGYGVGRGTQGDEDAQLKRLPANSEDEFLQRIQPLVATLRRRGQKLSKTIPLNVAGDDIEAQLEASLRDSYTFMLGIFREKNCHGYFPDVKFWRDMINGLGWESRFAAEISELRAAVIAYIEHCYNDAYNDCVQKRDPFWGGSMIRDYKLLIQFGAAVLVDPAKIDRCLTFELRFESLMTETSGDLGFRHRLHATVPVTFSGLDSRYWSGKDKLDYASIDAFFPPPPPICTFSGAGTGSTFVSRLRIDINLYVGTKRPADPVTLFYDVGRPFWGGQATCTPPPVTIAFPAPVYTWLNAYWQFLHASENVVPASSFVSRRWNFAGGSPWARKTYQKTAGEGGVAYEEKTSFELYHTPK